MKTITTLLAGSALLLLFSCSKTPSDDINQSVKKGYLFNTWIIDDDNTSNHNTTQNGNTFQNKKDPTITIAQNYSYTYSYKTGSAVVSETGHCDVDVNAKTITFYPNGGTKYYYDIIALSEEVFTLKATYSKTTTTTNAEGVATSTTSNYSETLYLEDND